MFQDFSAPPADAGNPSRVKALRTHMAEKNYTGFIVPRGDEHQGEYVPECAERLAWVSGFTGSAGQAIVLKDKAALFVDGRYTIQAREQSDADTFDVFLITEKTAQSWLEEHLTSDDVLAFDPWLHTLSEKDRFKKLGDKTGAEIVEADGNMVDAVWSERPAAPTAPISVQPIAFAGKEAKDKIAEIQVALSEEEADATVLSETDAIAWLFNIRGADIAHNPVALCYAIVPTSGKPTLFIDLNKVGNEEKEVLQAVVDLQPYDAFSRGLSALSGKVLVDPVTTSIAIGNRLEQAGCELLRKQGLCTLPRATKNKAELVGTRAAHIRDGAAISRFFSWLSKQEVSELDEIKAATKLEECRRAEGDAAQMPLTEISFDTISGVAGNGAIVHYRVTEATNKPFENDTLYLVDSGGQYRDGTTDITRTLAIGTPSAEMKRAFTLVLKGMIAISTSRFPEGTSGAQLDALARMALWQAGLDYGHGTGHGVGVFLNVHEGPQNISKRGHTPLKPGMILSNEPGYYKEGEYGIRIENLVVVSEATTSEGGEIPMHGFETLTFAPVDRNCINTDLLREDEREWLNAYHEQVWEKLESLFDGEEREWLRSATLPL